MHFVSIPAGSTSTGKVITIKNAGTSDLIINSITISGTSASEFDPTNDCTMIPADNLCTIAITFKPTLPFGKKSAIVSISSNDPKRPTVNVKILGNAPPPRISVSPKSIKFGSVTVGDTSTPKTITIKNTGISDLVINDINITGTNAGEFSQTSSCSTIPKGGSCVVNVTFGPVLPGKKSALIGISSNDPKKPIINVKFSGKSSGGSTPLTLSINPATLPAGQVNVPYNQSVTMMAKGGKAPYTYVCEGSGISGITVSTSLASPTGDSVVCTISGTPTTSDTYLIHFSVTDTIQSTASVGTIFWNVNYPPPPILETSRELFVVDGTNISVFDASADGHIAPLRTIGIVSAFDIALDKANNEIFVTELPSESVKVYEISANGHVSPIRTVSGIVFCTLWSCLIVHMPDRIDVDTKNNQVLVSTTNGGPIVFFPEVANGILFNQFDPIPAQVHYGIEADDIAIDIKNDEVFIADTDENSIVIYDRMALAGPFYRPPPLTIVPVRIIKGTSTGLSSPSSVVVDAINNEIFVANGNNSITIYARTDNGDVPPLRTISGASTGLYDPIDIAVDIEVNEMFVANGGNCSIVVFPRNASGNVTPLRTLSLDFFSVGRYFNGCPRGITLR